MNLYEEFRRDKLPFNVLKLWEWSWRLPHLRRTSQQVFAIRIGSQLQRELSIQLSIFWKRSFPSCKQQLFSEKNRSATKNKRS